MSNPLVAHFAGGTSAALLAPECAVQFDVCLDQAHRQMETAEFQAAAVSASDDYWAFEQDSYMARLKPYVVKNGILQIPVKGLMLNSFPFALGNWATGYDYIWQAFSRGMRDPDVKGVALVCDTPGGMVAGNFELVDKMWGLKGQKPIRGYASESAYSAGYSIISVSDTITVSRTGGVGSIGVVTTHVDESAMNDKIGIKITYIFAGKHKVDGNADEPLPKDVKARIQKRIDALYAVFVSTVARNRGMEEQAVRDTEALTFTASDAVEAGLADAIGSLDDSLAEYVADLSQDEDEEMSTRLKPQPVAAKPIHAEAEAARRARNTAILLCAEASDRPAAAMSTALHTDLSLEAARAHLARLPKESGQPLTAGVGDRSSEDAIAVARAMRLPGLSYSETTAPPPPSSSFDPSSADYTLAVAREMGGIPGLRLSTGEESSAAPTTRKAEALKAETPEFALAVAAAFNIPGLHLPDRA